MQKYKTSSGIVFLILLILAIDPFVMLVNSQPTWNVEVGDTFDYKINGYIHSLNQETLEYDIKRTFEGELGIEILEFGNFTDSGENGIKFNFTGYVKIEGDDDDVWNTGEEPATGYSDYFFHSILFRHIMSFPRPGGFTGVILSQETLNDFVSSYENIQDYIVSLAEYAENYTDNVEITKNETYDYGFEYEIMNDRGLFAAQKILYNEDGVLVEYIQGDLITYMEIKLKNFAIPGTSPLILGIVSLLGIFSLVYFVKHRQLKNTI